MISDAVRTTLGPRGMDKLIVDSRHNATISNDGATIMKLLDVVHPAARILVDIAKSPDFLAFIDKLGLAPADHPEKFGDVINAEVAQWKRLVAELQLPQL